MRNHIKSHFLQVTYYLTEYATGLDASTLLVLAPQGLPPEPPALNLCDLHRCTYGIQIDPYIWKGDLYAPPHSYLVDKVQDDFLSSYRDSADLVSFKGWQAEVCDKDNMPVMSGQMDHISEVMGDVVKEMKFLENPGSFSPKEADAFLPFLHDHITHKILKLVLTNLCK